MSKHTDALSTFSCQKLLAAMYLTGLWEIDHLINIPDMEAWNMAKQGLLELPEAWAIEVSIETLKFSGYLKEV